MNTFQTVQAQSREWSDGLHYRNIVALTDRTDRALTPEKQNAIKGESTIQSVRKQNLIFNSKV